MTQPVIQHRFKYICEKCSTHTAIECGDQRLTYGDLEKSVNLIARQLLGREIPKETFIGVFMEDRVGIIAAMLGILNAGCVFVPLDAALPNKRLEQMIQITGLSFIICDTSHLHRLEYMSVQKHQPVEPLLLEDLQVPCQFPEGHSLPDIEFGPEDKVYIYFTSGTTGTPKAVLGKNKSLLHFIDWEISAFGIPDTFRFSQFTTPGFDVFLRDILVPLCAGATICIPRDREIILDSRQLTEWIDQKQINLIHIVPSLFRLVHSYHQLEKNLFKYLQYILLAGEKVIPDELKNWYQTIGDRVQLVNIYGPTETTLAKLFYLIQPADTERKIMPVGKPINGARVIILDEKMEICDELEAGELYIRTPYRSFGYYNDEQLNKTKFIQNPFNQNPGDIIYKTGDLARLLPDGNIELLGRIDRQVKIRGMRVELEEIESVMVKHQLVKEAVVIKNEISNNIILLLAGITLVEEKAEASREDNAAILEQVKVHLAANLPDYMLPTQITILKKIPRKPNGKVDFDELPALLQFQKTEAASPQNDMEKRLLNTWAQVLGNQPPGVTHSFFELGGNSLNLMTLISRIHRDFDVRISLAQAFNNITIRKQAQLIKLAVEETFSAIEPTELKEYYPLSPAQKRLYIIQQMDVTSTGYHLPRVVPLSPGINLEKLEQAFCRLIQRHESLRTSFAMHDGEPIQKIHESVTFTFENYIQPQSIPPQSMPHFNRPFDLSRAPLLRAGIIEAPGKNYLLLVDIHHIVSDGLSLDILEKDFNALYNGEELPPCRLQYKDYSQWLNSEKEKSVIKKQGQYWLEQFQGHIPVLQLPTDFNRPQVQDFRGNTIPFELGIKGNETLIQLALDHEATLFMTLLTIYTIFLAKISRQDDIVVGTALAGRRHADLENVIGMFVNTLALRNHLEDEDSFTGLLERVRKRALEAFENQDYPFEDLVDQLAVNRDTSRNPLFDVMFVFNQLERSQTQSQRIPNKEKQPENPPNFFENDTSKFDMTLTCTEVGKELFFSWQYSIGLFANETIERFVGFFKTIISQVTRDPRIAVADIEIISQEEKEKILVDFNNTAADYPRNKTIHQLFAEQVEKTPDYVGLVGVFGHVRPVGPVGPVSLTYHQLNEQSDQLAGSLIEKGVLADDIIGFMMERSIEMIIGILGILKSGGAYLPIDPDYPQERINYILKDSAAKLLAVANDQEGAKVRRWEGEKIFLESFTYDSDHLKRRPRRGLQHSSAHHLAYIIYTSGTTGRPKGVMVEHAGIFNTIYWRKQEYNLTHEDRALQLFSFAFDGFLTSFFTPVVSGASVVQLSRDEIKDIFCIKEIIVVMGITHFICVPSLFRSLLEITKGDELSHLKIVSLAGEQIQPDLVEKCKQLYPQLELANAYGPTESSVEVSICRNITPGTVLPIGKPIANIAIYIIDKNENLLPPGIPGQLVISGKGLARGYLNNPELTAEKFKFNSLYKSHKSYKSYKSHIFYHTGDLARWLPDGNIEFLGRIDHQVKIRGFRVELGEIENQLRKHKAIKDAVVIDKESDVGPKYLCAYIVSDSTFSVSQLKEYLSGQLPDYMMPTYFEQVEKIPLTPNGKVDRKMLEAYGTRIGTGVEFAAPATDNEKIIADIWKEVLKMENVGIHDNFFEIGGNSLKIIQVSSKLREALGEDIPVVMLFRYTTISSIARNLEGKETNELFANSQHQLNEIAQGKEDRKQRLQKRRGNIDE